MKYLAVEAAPKENFKLSEYLVGEVLETEYNNIVKLIQRGIHNPKIKVRFPLTHSKRLLGQTWGSQAFGLQSELDRFNFESVKLPFDQIYLTGAVPLSCYERKVIGNDASLSAEFLAGKTTSYYCTRKISSLENVILQLEQKFPLVYPWQSEKIVDDNWLFVEARIYPLHVAINLSSEIATRGIVLELISREYPGIKVVSETLLIADNADCIEVVDGIKTGIQVSSYGLAGLLKKIRLLQEKRQKLVATYLLPFRKEVL